jgi:tetratricopeptide (TPR) repeat protein
VNRRLTEVADHLDAALGAARVADWRSSGVVQALREAASRDEPTEAASRLIEEGLALARRVQDVLEEALPGLASLDRQVDEVWLGIQRDRIRTAPGPQRAALWYRAAAQAIGAGAPRYACKLGDDVADPPLRLRLHQAGARALADGAPRRALDLLRFLVSPEGPGDLPADTRAELHVLVGRILLGASEDEHARLRALAHLHQAAFLAPASGAPPAALAAYHLAEGATQDAGLAAQESRRLDPDRPDGLVALGRWAESQDDAEGAREFYDRAVDTIPEGREPLTALGSLAGPLPPALVLRVAARLLRSPAAGGEAERVLRTLDLARLDDASAAEAEELRARALVGAGREADRADALFRAGQRRGWAGDPKGAEDLLRAALEVDGRRTDIVWELSDVLRLRAASGDREGPRLLDEGLALWREAHRRSPVPPDLSWTYLNRALISAQLADRPRADRWSMHWEAVMNLELSLLLDDRQARRWSLLANTFQNIGELAALDAAESGLAVDPGYADANDERMIALSNLGRFDEALAALEAHPDPAWASSVRAFALLRDDRPREALEQVERALAGGGAPAVWQLQLRAECFRAIGDQERAEDDLRSVVERTKGSRDVDLIDELGTAYFELGQLDAARPVFARLAPHPVLGPRALQYLGLCDLAAARAVPGETALVEGIARCGNPRLLADLLRFGITRLEALAGEGDVGRTIAPVLERTRARATERMRALEGRTAEDELTAVLAGCRPRAANGEPNVVWIGAVAALARIRTRLGRFQEAARLYGLLAHLGLPRADGGVRVWEPGIRRCVEGLLGLADAHLRAGSPEHAWRLIEDARLACGPGHDGELAGAVAVRAAWARLLRGDGAGLSRELAAARREDGTPDAGRRVAAALAALAPGAGERWAMRRALRGDADDGVGDAVLSALGDGLALRHDDQRNEQLLPLTIPIVVELGPGLVPDEGEETPLVTEHAPRIRSAIDSEMGVTVPGFRFRQADADVPGLGYRILLFEALCATGEVDPGAEDPLDVLARRLEAVLRTHLDEFLGLQELEALIDDWCREEEDAALIERHVPDLHARSRVLAVLRRLVGEQVPILRWREILPIAAAPDHALEKRVRQARLALRDQLPGTAPGATRVAVPAELLEGAGLGPPREGILSPPPVTAHRLLDLVRRDGAGEDRALVVDGAVRAAVRELVRMEFPELPVLAQDEVEDAPTTLLAHTGAGTGPSPA